MRGRGFEIEYINWLAVVLISAFFFIFGFTFFNEWIATLFMVVSILTVSFVTGRYKPGRVTKVIDITPKETEIVVRKEND